MNQIYNVDCLKGMKAIEDNSIDCIITSPPYNKKGLARKKKGVIGNQIWKKYNIDYATYEDNLPEEEYQAWMIDVVNEMVRIIKPDGSIFFNHKPRRYKNQAHLPTDFIDKTNAVVYQVIIWNRANSPNIRNDILVPCVEYVYWLRKEKPKVFRSQIDPHYKTEVWKITPTQQQGHPAAFPPKLVENCINLATVEGDVVLDPFMGAGTTAAMAKELNRKWLGFEIDTAYIDIFNQATLKGLNNE
jgi:modification methylase|tara:strand:+ start:147 stop:878 length:732 start_codon:yes stop_codon:yes gene_type:complete